MANRANAASCVMLCLLPVFAAAEGAEDPNDQLADMALIEFLGEWQDAEGEWLDPTMFGDTTSEYQSSDKEVFYDED